MLEQGIMVMIAGMTTVFLFLVLLALLMMISSKIILRCSPPVISTKTLQPNDLIAVIATAIYHQKIDNQ